MRRLVLSLFAMASVALLAAPASQASFGLKDLDVLFENADGSIAPQAGAHPDSFTTTVGFNTRPDSLAPFEVPDGDPRNLRIAQMPGLVADPTAIPRCSNAEFLAKANNCPRVTRLGTNTVTFNEPGETVQAPVYNLPPPPGAVLKLGFYVLLVPITIEVGLSEEPPYEGVVTLGNISNTLPVYHSKVELWGVPADPAHDAERGGAVDIAPEPFLTAPRACTGPLATRFEASSWQGESFEESILTRDEGEPPAPLGMVGCGQLGFGPEIEAKPTSKAASSPSGLDFSLRIDDEGLSGPEGLAGSDIEKTVVTLPEGMTANPSLAEGLEVCTEAQLGRESSKSAPGEGCPEASKIGTLEAESPLLEGELLKGSLYVAEPYANPSKSLIALYMVIKDRGLGISVKLPGKVEPDPRTGQLTTTFEDLPQLPISRFSLHFREGGRSPLITPPGCGTHTVLAKLYPWAGGQPLSETSRFETIAGPGGGPCPSPGKAPFVPGFEAGTLDNTAGGFSPFHLRLTRKDGEQDLTKLSTVLPPGVLGSLVGLAKCSEGQIAAAKARSGPHGGAEELASPSCPAASRIGSTLTGAGVGSQLTWVPGSLYLAGPYKGAPLSVVAIVPGVAGPFDVGTIVVRVALDFDPLTAQARADGSKSDPIPHILRGIPLNVRDIRVRVDRPRFIFNPTSCEPSQSTATLFGSNLDLFDPADDVGIPASARFQAADCASLGFAPRLKLELKGGAKRGAHPALTGTYLPRPGDANLDGLVLRLPRSAFLDQAHIRTICTRVQFAVGEGNGAGCPPGSVYGKATAWTPLLEEPLSGPVYLRSSDHNLPDFVAALHGIAEIEAVARIDSVKGGIRASFEDLPDAPLSKAVVRMQGAKKGLIVNSTDLCAGQHRASAAFRGQNGRRHKATPSVAAECGGARKHKRR